MKKIILDFKGLDSKEQIQGYLAEKMEQTGNEQYKPFFAVA